MTDRIPHLRPAGLLALALVALAGAGTRGDEGRWVGTWPASPQRTEPADLPPAPGLADATIRQVVRVSLGGRRWHANRGPIRRSAIPGGPMPLIEFGEFDRRPIIVAHKPLSRAGRGSGRPPERSPNLSSTLVR